MAEPAEGARDWPLAVHGDRLPREVPQHVERRGPMTLALLILAAVLLAIWLVDWAGSWVRR